MMKSRKTKFNNKGFTLIETLIVVAITVILLSLAIVGVAQYIKSMHQLEMDGAAKEIYVAAQNHLSMAESEGYLGRDNNGTSGSFEGTKWEDDNVSYFVVDNSKGEDDKLGNEDSFLNLMLPYGSVDGEVRTDGSYIIVYQKDTARVVEVYYAKDTGRFGHVFTDDGESTEYKDLIDNFGEDITEGETLTQNKKLRRNYGKNSILNQNGVIDNENAVIGYYGGETNQITGDALNEFTEDGIEVINQDKLLVKLTDPNASWQDSEGYSASLKLIITGVTSGAEKEILIKSPDAKDTIGINGNVSIQSDNSTIVVTLDDITNQSHHFAKLFPEFIPGENITVKAVSYSKYALTNIAESAEVSTNSLFAAVSANGTTDVSLGETTTKVVTNEISVAYTRHLENLSGEISGFVDEVIDSKLYITGVKQIADISFLEKGSALSIGDTKGFRENIGSTEFYITTLPSGEGDADKETQNKFRPIKYGSIDGDKALIYDGGNHKIIGVDIEKTNDDNAGLFSSLIKGSKVSNLELVNFNVKAESGDAGILAGSVDKSEIKGILVHNGTSTAKDDETALEISGGGNVGGFAGTINESKLTYCVASVYVRDSGSTGTIGGFAGSMTSATVKGCYSGGHTASANYTEETEITKSGRINVLGGKNTTAGGFTGKAENSNILSCYSTCSVKGLTAAGFAGSLTDGSVENSYVTGEVYPVTENAGTKAFVNSYSGTNFSGDIYLLNVSSNDESDNISGISGESADDESASIVVVEDERTTAFPYDDTLKLNYKGKYYYKSLKQLGVEAVDSKDIIAGNILNYHYGDFEIPEVVITEAEFEVYNFDKLYLELEEEDDVEHIIIALKGQKSGTIESYVLSTSGKVEKHFVINGDSGSEVSAPANYNFQVVKTDIGYRVILDDITTSYSHFNELFPNLTPGENIYVYAATGDADVTAVKGKMSDGTVEKKKTNSLFGLSDSSIGEANISYIRHLQNLDPNVSGVDSAVTKAYLINDLNWKQDNCDGLQSIEWSSSSVSIKDKDSSASLGNGFYGIYNTNLTVFDGNYFTLRNFEINGAPSSFGSNGAGNAGLFRLSDNSNLVIKNVRLDQFEVKSSDEYAGTLAAEVTGNLTCEKVLVTGDETVTGSKSSGGMIGSFDGSGKSLEITNCAASVKVKSEEKNAGGLIGYIGAGSIEIKNSYAGGHTSESKYDTENASAFNVTASNGCAGGLIGVVSSDASMTMSKCGSAESVSGNCAGGVIGKIGGTQSISSTYTVAPVSGTTSGAFIGQALSGNSITSSSENYYLLDAYSEHSTKAYDEITGVKVVGSGSISATVTETRYFTEGTTNPISGAYNKANIAQKTITYDSDLSGREYPFILYTNLPKYSGESTFKRIYYGDWEPSVRVALKAGNNIRFTYYTDPEDKTSEQAIVEDANLNTQDIITGEANSVIEPYVTDKLAGYKVVSWDIYTADADNKPYELVKENVAADEKGFISLSKDICTSNLIAVANYEPVDSDIIVNFRYGENGIEGSDGNLICKQQAVEKNTALKDLGNSINIPSKTFNNYTFEGWYTDEKCTDENKVDLEKGTQTVSANVTYYAKYIPIEYYTVNVDFLYQIDDEAERDLSSTPLYSMDGEKSGSSSSYSIKYVVGKTFDQDIELPAFGTDYTGIKIGKYDEDGEIVESTSKDSKGITLSEDEDKIHVTCDSDSHYVVVYRLESDDNTCKYKIKYTMKNTKQKGDSVDGAIVRTSDDLVYDKSESCGFYYRKNGKTLEYTIDKNKEIEIGDIPSLKSIIGDDANGWKRVTTSIPAKANLEQDADGTYIVEIEYERKSYAISFNTDGGKVIQTKTLMFGEPLSDVKPAASDVSKDGDVLDEDKYAEGWKIYDKKDTSKKHKYNWNSTMPANEIVAQTNWKAGTANYTIVYWKQSVFNHKDLKWTKKTYDFAGKDYVTTGNGKVGTTPVLSKDVLEKYNSQTRIEDDDFYHFYYARNDANEKTIAADGSTVVNIYYDRELLTYDYYLDNSKTRYSVGNGGKSYEKASDDDSDDIACYGYIDTDNDGKEDTYIVLNKEEDGTWTYQKEKTSTYTKYVDKEYKGDVYHKASKTENEDTPYSVYILSDDGNSFIQKDLYYVGGKWYETQSYDDSKFTFNDKIDLYSFRKVSQGNEASVVNSELYIKDGDDYVSADLEYYDGEDDNSYLDKEKSEKAEAGFYKSKTTERIFKDEDKVAKENVYKGEKASASSDSTYTSRDDLYVESEGTYTKTSLYEGNSKFFKTKYKEYQNPQVVYSMTEATTNDKTLAKVYTEFFERSEDGETYSPATVYYSDGSDSTRKKGDTEEAEEGFYENCEKITEYTYSGTSYEGFTTKEAEKTEGGEYTTYYKADGDNYVPAGTVYSDGNKFYTRRNVLTFSDPVSNVFKMNKVTTAGVVATEAYDYYTTSDDGTTYEKTTVWYADGTSSNARSGKTKTLAEEGYYETEPTSEIEYDFTDKDSYKGYKTTEASKKDGTHYVLEDDEYIEKNLYYNNDKYWSKKFTTYVDKTTVYKMNEVTAEGTLAEACSDYFKKESDDKYSPTTVYYSDGSENTRKTGTTEKAEKGYYTTEPGTEKENDFTGKASYEGFKTTTASKTTGTHYVLEDGKYVPQSLYYSSNKYWSKTFKTYVDKTTVYKMNEVTAEGTLAEKYSNYFKKVSDDEYSSVAVYYSDGSENTRKTGTTEKAEKGYYTDEPGTQTENDFTGKASYEGFKTTTASKTTGTHYVLEDGKYVPKELYYNANTFWSKKFTTYENKTTVYKMNAVTDEGTLASNYTNYFEKISDDKYSPVSVWYSDGSDNTRKTETTEKAAKGYYTTEPGTQTVNNYTISYNGFTPVKTTSTEDGYYYLLNDDKTKYVKTKLYYKDSGFNKGFYTTKTRSGSESGIDPNNVYTLSEAKLPEVSQVSLENGFEGVMEQGGTYYKGTFYSDLGVEWKFKLETESSSSSWWSKLFDSIIKFFTNQTYEEGDTYYEATKIKNPTEDVSNVYVYDNGQYKNYSNLYYDSETDMYYTEKLKSTSNYDYANRVTDVYDMNSYKPTSVSNDASATVWVEDNEGNFVSKTLYHNPTDSDKWYEKDGVKTCWTFTGSPITVYTPEVTNGTADGKYLVKSGDDYVSKDLIYNSGDGYENDGTGDTPQATGLYVSKKDAYGKEVKNVVDIASYAPEGNDGDSKTVLIKSGNNYVEKTLYYNPKDTSKWYEKYDVKTYRTFTGSPITVYTPEVTTGTSDGKYLVKSENSYVSKSLVYNSGDGYVDDGIGETPQDKGLYASYKDAYGNEVENVVDIASYAPEGNDGDSKQVLIKSGDNYVEKTLYYNPKDTSKWYAEYDVKTYRTFSGSPITVYTPEVTSGTSDGTYLVKSGSNYESKSLVYNDGDGYVDDGIGETPQDKGLYASSKDAYANEVKGVVDIEEYDPVGDENEGKSVLVKSGDKYITKTLYHNPDDSDEWYEKPEEVPYYAFTGNPVTVYYPEEITGSDKEKTGDYLVLDENTGKYITKTLYYNDQSEENGDPDIEAGLYENQKTKYKGEISVTDFESYNPDDSQEGTAYNVYVKVGDNYQLKSLYYNPEDGKWYEDEPSAKDIYIFSDKVTVYEDNKIENVDTNEADLDNYVVASGENLVKTNLVYNDGDGKTLSEGSLTNQEKGVYTSSVYKYTDEVEAYEFTLADPEDSVDGEYYISSDSSSIDESSKTMLYRNKDDLLNWYKSKEDITVYKDKVDVYKRSTIGNTTGTCYVEEDGKFVKTSTDEYVYNDGSTSDQDGGWYKSKTASGGKYFKDEYVGTVYDKTESDSVKYSDASSRSNYGILNGEIVTLGVEEGTTESGTTYAKFTYVGTEDEEYTDYEDVKYEGDRYKLDGFSAPLTGLYGQQLAKYGYDWPSNYGWIYFADCDYTKDSDLEKFLTSSEDIREISITDGNGESHKNQGMSFLGEFVVDSKTGTNFYFRSIGSATNYNFFYLQNVDGSYNTDNNKCTREDGNNYTYRGGIKSGGAGIWFSDKFIGFHYIQYRFRKAGNTSWTNIKTGTDSVGGEVNYNDEGVTDPTKNDSTYVRYQRLSYKLSFFDNSNLNESIKDVDILYEDTLKNGLEGETLPTLEDKDGKEWDGKYYKDSACSTEIDFAEEQMPAASYAVYLKRVPKTFTVKFYSDSSCSDDELLGTYKRKLNKTLEDPPENDGDGTMFDENGELLDSVIPADKKVGGTTYEFDKWVYKDGSKETEFPYSLKIDKDYEVYATWKVKEEEKEPEKKTVTVKYMYEDTSLKEDDVHEDEYYAGDNVTFFAERIEKDGKIYYPDRTAIKHTVKDSKEDSDNIVIFTYSLAQSWEYTAEYYIVFESEEDENLIKKLDGKDFELTEKAAFKVGSEEKTCEEQYCTVEYDLPDSLSALADKYDLSYTSFDGKQSMGTYTTIHKMSNGDTVVKYYLVPDWDKIDLSEIYHMYDGDNKAEITSKKIGDTINLSNDTKYDVWNIYAYYQDDKTLNTIAKAGIYDMTAYVIYEVDGNAEINGTEVGKGTYYFLVYKDTSKDLNLRIDKQRVKIISDSLEKAAGDEPVYSHSVTIEIGEDDDKIIRKGVNADEAVALLGTDTINVIFTEEAFRLDTGTSKNSFIVEGDSDVLSNYIIETEFGTLTVN